jgi:histidinol phosphatase-like enzyme
MNRAVFIDKDGTLIKNVPYNIDPALIILDPYAIKALQLLHQQDFTLFMVTNQALHTAIFPKPIYTPFSYTLINY